MKKIFTLAIALFAFAGIASAQRMLHINKANGTSIDYEVSSVASITFSEDTSWQTIGMGEYTEGVLSDFFGYEYFGDFVTTWEVEIQEKVDQPGLYRVVNPYKDFPYNWTFQYFYGGGYDDTQNYYLEINATDPDHVTIKTIQDMGLDTGIYGEFYLWCIAEYYMSMGYTWEEEAAYGDFGTLKDGVITFPQYGLYIQLGSSFVNYANYYENFKLVLPETVSGSKKKETVAKPQPTENGSLKLYNELKPMGSLQRP